MSKLLETAMQVSGGSYEDFCRYVSTSLRQGFGWQAILLKNNDLGYI
jgi:hypothetical protein